ncbi:hypothetical protein BDK51DRAFT_27923, partial [Blyttiomyces helicus]
MTVALPTQTPSPVATPTTAPAAVANPFPDGKPTGVLTITVVQANGLKKAKSNFLTTCSPEPLGLPLIRCIPPPDLIDHLNPYTVISINERPAAPALVPELPTHTEEEYHAVQRTKDALGAAPIWDDKIWFIVYGKLGNVFFDLFDKTLEGTEGL